MEDRGHDEAVTQEVDGRAVVGAHPRQRCRPRIGLGPQVDVLGGVVERGVDQLPRFGVDLEETHVAGPGLARRTGAGPMESGDVEFAPELDVLRDVGRHGRIHVLREPHAELCLGQRERLCVPTERAVTL
ncbi:hypothetical protein KAREA_37500 [Prescottella equi]|nr:hypothetical protein KAREA_37500 [Prescottella equi]